MERRSRALGPALFAPEGVMEQVERLVRGPARGARSSALSCVPKPDTLPKKHVKWYNVKLF
jgi:hypothetical protein